MDAACTRKYGSRDPEIRKPYTRKYKYTLSDEKVSNCEQQKSRRRRAQAQRLEPVFIPVEQWRRRSPQAWAGVHIYEKEGVSRNLRPLIGFSFSIRVEQNCWNTSKFAYLQQQHLEPYILAGDTIANLCEEVSSQGAGYPWELVPVSDTLELHLFFKGIKANCVLVAHGGSRYTVGALTILARLPG